MLCPKTKIIVSLLLISALSGCGDEVKAQAAPNSAVEVGVAILQPQTVALTADLPGRVTAYKSAEIRPQVSGIILSRNFEEGGLVKAGQQLYQIDPALYEAAYHTAAAQLQHAQATFKSSDLMAQRYKELVGSRAVSRQEYDDAVSAQAQAAADVASAKAAVETAQINLNYTKVLSPISGRIGKSSVTPGALVTANQSTAMALVQQLDPIYVDLTQSSSDLMRLRQRLSAEKAAGGEGKAPEVELTLDALSQTYAHKGELQFSDVTVDPATGNVQVRAQFPNPEEQLLPGLFVRARLEQGALENVFLVPQQSIIRTSDGSAMAWVVDADGKAQIKPVQIRQAQNDKWIVTSGLQAGEKVIVEGVIKLQKGVPVKAVEAGQSAPAATPAKEAH